MLESERDICFLLLLSVFQQCYLGVFWGAVTLPVHPKGDQSWVFTGRTDAEAETPVLWPPDVKS